MKITVDGDLDYSFKISKKALNSLGMKIDSSSKKNEYIQASTGSSLLSWGEDIQLDFYSIGSNKVTIEISSEAKAQIGTWGKNNRNIREIGNEIKYFNNKNK